MVLNSIKSNNYKDFLWFRLMIHSNPKESQKMNRKKIILQKNKKKNKHKNKIFLIFFFVLKNKKEKRRI